METIVNRAGRSGDERISALGLGTLRTAIWQDVATSGRLYTLKGADTPESSDTAEAAEIAKLTELSDGDSVHRLVMDLRKAAAGRQPDMILM
jgi:hypothetical protein